MMIRIHKARCWVVGCSCDDCRAESGGTYYLDKRGNASADRRGAREFGQFSDAEAARAKSSCRAFLVVMRRGRPS